ncbi:hypothetical protein HanOQP8_Chr02g0076521 [Helianthus annuus]|nr:hypothetical protein HanLR1_Chr02g0065601 [Helianthus annuus]KAJ0786898.1 hypothetical protein HanOQP8_Chr02g0076521 [Helianthus annuus]
MFFQTTIPTAESKGESKDELNTRGSVDSRCQESILKELVIGKPGVDPESTEA